MIKARYPPETAVQESVWYKAVLNQASMLQQAVKDSREEIFKLNKQLDELQSSRSESERKALVSTPVFIVFPVMLTVSLQAESEEILQELRNMVAKRDSENSRLREQRDQMSAEANEWKGKSVVKGSAVTEAQTLLTSHSVSAQLVQYMMATDTADLVGPHASS